MAERPNPFTFLQQVRSEAIKVVWPSRRETAISTVMVFVMAFIAACSSCSPIRSMSYAISFLLGIGTSAG